MTKEQLLEKIEHIKEAIQTYPDDTKILGADISKVLRTVDVHVANNIDKIAINNNLGTLIEPVKVNFDDASVATGWRIHSITHANGVRTCYLEPPHDDKDDKK